MTIRTSPWPTGVPCWLDLFSPDLAVAKDFYAGILGWTFLDLGQDFGNYHIAQRKGHSAAGLAPVMENAPTGWTLYFGSDDLEATARLITGEGGTVVMGPSEVPGKGRFLIATDPGGVAFGVWEQRGFIGTELVNEPGGLVWEQLMSADPAIAQRFYASVFGWSYDPVEGTDDFVTFKGTGSDPLGGLGGTFGGSPSWSVHFSVDDTDAAVSFAQRAGGQVIRPAEDTPYGRMAVLMDPFGAAFGVFTAPAGQPGSDA